MEKNMPQSIALSFKTQHLKVGKWPYSLGINPITNKIYVANREDGTVSIIDGGTNEVEKISTGKLLQEIAINEVTNKIYITTKKGVLVLEGSDNSFTMLPAIEHGGIITLNTNINRICVGTWSGKLSIIDGASHAFHTMDLADSLTSIAIHELTHNIYVTHRNSGTLTCIDGKTFESRIVEIGNTPLCVTVDAKTHRIYVGHDWGKTFNIIDGIDFTIKHILIDAFGMHKILLNQQTQKVYIMCKTGGIAVLERDEAITSYLDTSESPNAMVLDENMNRIWVAAEGRRLVKVFDENSHTSIDLAAGKSPRDIAINITNNKIYVVNSNANSVTVFEEKAEATPPKKKVPIAKITEANISIIDTALKIFFSDSDKARKTFNALGGHKATKSAEQALKGICKKRLKEFDDSLLIGEPESIVSTFDQKTTSIGIVYEGRNSDVFATFCKGLFDSGAVCVLCCTIEDTTGEYIFTVQDELSITKYESGIDSKFREIPLELSDRFVAISIFEELYNNEETNNAKGL